MADAVAAAELLEGKADWSAGLPSFVANASGPRVQASAAQWPGAGQVRDGSPQHAITKKISASRKLPTGERL